MSKEATKQIVTTLNENPGGLYCFAGGDTPVRTLELLVKAHRKKEVDLHKAFYIQLDEWVGLDSSNEGSCQAYLKENLFDPAAIPKDHVHLLDGTSKQLEKECKEATQFIKEHNGITLSLLGVGVNGHLGFNEPGSSPTSETRVVDLTETTKTVGEKYFSKKTETTKGITLGLKELTDSKTIIVEASGETKYEAVKKLREGKPDKKWPVTLLTNHTNCTVIVDKKVVELEKTKK